MESKLTKHQVKVFTKKLDDNRTITAALRFDDRCGTGHNTFSATAEIRRARARDCDSCGMLHDDIAEHFPELEKYLKWHLCSTDGPMHYIANTLYHASDKDCYGKRKGEPSAFTTKIQFEVSPGLYFPITFPLKSSFAEFLTSARTKGDKLTLVELTHNSDSKTFKPKYTFEGFGRLWHECPFDTRQEAEEFQAALSRYNWEIVKVPTAWSEGKEPDLAAARACAIWPDAELEDITSEALTARLPALLDAFRADMEELGFTW